MQDTTVPGKGKAIASLVLGFCACVFAWMGYGALLAIAASIVGIILGVQARKEMPAGKAGMATAGLVLSIIALALSSIVFIACVACIGAVGGLGGLGGFGY